MLRIAPTPTAADEITRRFGLTGGDYLLSVGYLGPEEAPGMLLRAFARVPGNMKLVIAGGTSYTNKYTAELQKLAATDRRVIMAGYVFGSTLAELYTNAAAFVLPSDQEGLPLTLLEAASYGLPLVASGIPPHVEVLGETGPGRRVFRPGDEDALMYALRVTLRNLDGDREAAAVFANDLRKRYGWDVAAEETERISMCLKALHRAGRRRRQAA